MNCKIMLIKENELMTPGTSALWCDETEDYAMFTVTDLVQIEWKKGKIIIHPGSVIIANNFRIINSGPSIVQLKGIVFKLKEVKHVIEEPIILKSNEMIYEDAINIISSCNSKTVDYDIKVIERRINGFFSSNFDCEFASYQLEGQIDKRLIYVYRYIHNNYSNPITLQDLADLISSNPVYLSNIYSKVFKISPMQDLQKVRMEKAVSLLCNSQLTIKEITTKLGYISSSHFSSIFKRHYGMVPTKYRIKHTIHKFGKGVILF